MKDVLYFFFLSFFSIFQLSIGNFFLNQDRLNWKKKKRKYPSIFLIIWKKYLPPLKKNSNITLKLFHKCSKKYKLNIILDENWNIKWFENDLIKIKIWIDHYVIFRSWLYIFLSLNFYFQKYFWNIYESWSDNIVIFLKV